MSRRTPARQQLRSSCGKGIWCPTQYRRSLSGIAACTPGFSQGLQRSATHCHLRIDVSSPWANSKKTSLNGCSFLSPGRNVCLLILKEEGLKMMNPFVGRKKPCRMLSKRNFFPPLSDGRYPPRTPDQVHVPAFKLVLTSIGLQLRHARRSL